MPTQKIHPIFKNLKIDPSLTPRIIEAICHPCYTTDYQSALKQAAANNMRILAAFTGYEWCPYSKALSLEVFNTCDFGMWTVSKDLTLLYIDLAAAPWKSPAPLEQQELLTKYQVTGFPTVIGLNANGSERGRVAGYSAGTGDKTWMQLFENAAKLNVSEP